MISKDDFLLYGEIGKLYKYLALNENNFIEVDNGMCKLRLRMTNSGNIVCKNLNFPNVKELNYNDMCFPENLLGIIQQLKETKPTNVSNTSRWEEISIEVGMVSALNNLH